MRNKTLKRTVTALLLGTLALGSMAGCGKQDSDAEYKLSVVTSASAAPINPLVQVAEVNGYFEEYGLEIEYVPLETSGVFESVSTGKVDTTYGQLIPPLSYGAQGSDVTLFGGTQSGGMAAVCRAEDYEELKNLENWKDKNIGVIQLSTSEMITKYVLGNEYGYKIGEDLNFTYIDDYPSIPLAVGKKTIDIGFIASQYIESAEDQGLVELFPLTELMPDFVCCRQTAYSVEFEDNRDAYVAYLKAQIKAYRDYKTDYDKTIEAVSKESEQDEAFVETYLYDAEGSANRAFNPDPNYNGTLAVYQTLLEWDYIEQGVELSDFYDLSVYADALKQVIEEYPDEQFYKDMWTYFRENNSEYPDFDSLYGDSFLSL